MNTEEVRKEGADYHDPNDSIAEIVIKKNIIEIKNRGKMTAGNIDADKIGPDQRNHDMIPPEKLIPEMKHTEKMNIGKKIVGLTDFMNKRPRTINSDNVRPEQMNNENLRQGKINPEYVRTEQMNNSNVRPEKMNAENIRPWNIRPKELSLQRTNLSEPIKEKLDVWKGSRDALSSVSLSSLTHLSAVVGLEMEDQRLVSAVRGALLPPAGPDEAYNLDFPGLMRNSQFQQDALTEEIFLGKVRGHVVIRQLIRV